MDISTTGGESSSFKVSSNSPKLECLDESNCTSMEMTNPFGSFRHEGPLPYSMFEDSSSFSCTPTKQKSYCRQSLVNHSNSTINVSSNSTHIYINALDETDNRITHSDGQTKSTLVSAPHAITPNRKRFITKNLKKMGQVLHNVRDHKLQLKTLAFI